jgi:hypothetical protein
MTFIPRGWSAAARCLAGTTILSLLLVLPARGIEMFTYFGDGSRIGLPSLEVPVQAYPGIPLRSDRIRARARAQQLRRAAPVDQPGTPPGRGHHRSPDGDAGCRTRARHPDAADRGPVSSSAATVSGALQPANRRELVESRSGRPICPGTDHGSAAG